MHAQPVSQNVVDVLLKIFVSIKIRLNNEDEYAHIWLIINDTGFDIEWVFGPLSF